ncbi:MAG: hypothetical protein ABR615_02405 [Pseudonocardiaceae bacterium]
MAPLAAGQALVVGFPVPGHCILAPHADREALPDVQRLAAAMQTAVIT